jgi:excisionase family DNA binding protein
MPQKSEQVSIREACEILGVSKPTIYRLINADELHPIKKKIGAGIGGRRVFFDRTEVESLRNATQTPDEPTNATRRGRGK